MLTHGRRELGILADGCRLQHDGVVQGWRIDKWTMSAEDISAAVDVYEAVLMGDSDEIVELLLDSGINLPALLLDSDNARDEITRSDICEYVAAGAVIADRSCDVETLEMPNVPKMSRRKSDSGFDIVDVKMHSGNQSELVEGEVLTVVSVKHTLQQAAYGLRTALVRSLSTSEMTEPYIVSQLRVLNGRLESSGVPAERAQRIYLFFRDFHNSEFVKLVATGVVEPINGPSFRDQLEELPDRKSSHLQFRVIVFEGLAKIHERCP